VSWSLVGRERQDCSSFSIAERGTRGAWELGVGERVEIACAELRVYVSNGAGDSGQMM